MEYELRDFSVLFQCGDKVKLSAIGEGRYEDSYSNPHGAVGGVCDFSSEPDPEWPIEVDWGCGWTNCYKPEDLELLLC